MLHLGLNCQFDVIITIRDVIRSNSEVMTSNILSRSDVDVRRKGEEGIREFAYCFNISTL